MGHAPGVRRNQSLGRAIRVLAFLAEQPRGVSVAEVARATGLSAPTTGRLVATLVDAGFVERTRDGQGWVLGLELVRIARAADPYRQLPDVARPALVRLAAATGEAAALTVTRWPDVDVVSQVRGTRLVSISSWVGRRFSFHVSVAGKLAAAARSDGDLDRFLSGQRLDAYTERTMWTAEAFLGEVRRVREIGYAESVDELEVGLTSVGVVVDADVGADISVGIAGPTSRLGDLERRASLAPLRGCAREIASILRR